MKIVNKPRAIRVIHLIWRNVRLRNWIRSHFKTSKEKDAAWETFRWIRKEFPMMEKALRGELIECDVPEFVNIDNIEEITNGSN